VFTKALDVFSQLNISYSTKQVVWLVANATAYGYKSVNGLQLAAELVEKGLNVNFRAREAHSALADVCHYLPDYASDYPIEAKAAARCIGPLYHVGLHKVKGKDWLYQNIINKLIKFRYEKLKSGEFESFDHMLKEGRVKLAIEKGMSPEVAELYFVGTYAAIHGVMNHNLTSWDPSPNYLMWGELSKALELGKYNLTPQDYLNGKTPFEYMYNKMLEDMNNPSFKNSLIKGLYRWYAYSAMKINWPFSTASFAAHANTDWANYVKEKFAWFYWAKYWPLGKYACIREQDSPFFSSITAYMLNIPKVAFGVIYPRGGHGHDEISMIAPDGSLMGFWSNGTALLLDYSPANPVWQGQELFLELRTGRCGCYELTGWIFKKNELYKVFQDLEKPG